MGLRAIGTLVASSAVLIMAGSVAAQDANGVLITHVAAGGPAQRAGLQPGDLLLRWEQFSASGSLSSAFDIAEVEAEWGPRGPVHLFAERGGEPVEAAVFPDEWGLDVRPPLAAEALTLFESAQTLRDSGDTDAAISKLRELALGPAVPAWAWLEVARAEAQRGDADAVDRAVQEAIRRAAAPFVEAQLWAFLGRTLHGFARFEEALAALEKAVALRRERNPEALATAALFEPLARTAYDLGRGMEKVRPDLDAARIIQERMAPRSLALARTLTTLGPILDSEVEARRFFESALAIETELAPESLLMALTLRRLATVTSERARKLELARQALAIRELRAPDSLEVADSLRQLGVHLNRYGQPGLAEEHYRRALAIVHRLAPDTAPHARLLNALAILRRERGDLGESESLYRRSVSITEVTQPASIWLAIAELNLGETLRQRQDLDAAERHLQRSLAIVEKEAPKSDVAGYVLTTLAEVLRERGALDQAEPLLRSALGIFRDADPTNQMIPYIYAGLADLLGAQGDIAAGRVLYREALDRTRAQLPGSNALADIYAGAGGLALLAGADDAAERHYRDALQLRLTLAPGSFSEAEAHHALGVIARRRGDAVQALGHFRRAVEALEHQSQRLGDDHETAVRFREAYQEYYRDLEEALLEQGQEEAAFDAVERSRSRALLALLGTRVLNFESAIPEALAAKRRQADEDHDRVLERFAHAGSTLREAELVALYGKLHHVRQQQTEIRAQIRSAVPRLAAILDPVALDLAGVRRALDPETLLLSFSVGKASTRIYAVGPGADDFAVHRLEIGEKQLRRAVERFRGLIEERPGGGLAGAVETQSRLLSEMLLAPVRVPFSKAKRLLVAADGPLFLLPFSALRDPADQSQSRYAIEALPLHMTSSVTLYALLESSGQRDSEATHVVGFGDPVYASAREDAAASLRRAIDVGLRLEPLPWTQRELEALQTLEPEHTRLWTGADATEERVRELRPGSRVVHFACHGFLDERFPLESGLALSMPPDGTEGRHNGLLQAWEVFEAVHLDADLVTLSACRTALGREVAGEGILGLIWAFQYAGARSIVASLWDVNDRSTAELMRGFYAYLRQGDAKAEALRRAQVDMLRERSTSAPFHWAAFQLTGRWR